MLLDEIGIEQEVWLLDANGKIVEPAVYSFPHDDFGFLVELRSRPHQTPEPIMDDMKNLQAGFSELAKNFGLRLEIKDSMPIDKWLINYLDYWRTKYNYYNLKDLTENITPGSTRTHATGFSDSAEILTAGIHVHFSRKLDGKRVQLPIQEIVKTMDEKFKDEISKANRISGEYEIKPYGFEYRSLPASCSLHKVVYTAFTVLGGTK